MVQFKYRYGIVYKHVSGKAAAVNTEGVESSKTSMSFFKFPNCILVMISSMWSNYAILQSNHLIPAKTFTLNRGRYTGGNFNKYRVFVRKIEDSTEKIKFFVNDKSRNRKSFKKKQSFLCEYANQKPIWMTGYLFLPYMRDFYL